MPLDSLERYLTANLEGFRGPMTVTQFKVGLLSTTVVCSTNPLCALLQNGQSNPTYLIKDAKCVVLLLFPPPPIT